MDFEHILKEVHRLSDEGSEVYRRLRESAKALGKRQFEALKAEAKERLITGLTELALKLTAGKGPKS